MPGLLLNDIRAHDGEYTSNRSGLAVILDSGKMEYKTWFDQKKVQDIYYQEEARLLGHSNL